MFVSAGSPPEGENRELKTLTVAIALLVVVLLLPLLQANVVNAADIPTIYIRPDGQIEGTDNIQPDGNHYRFTANVSGRIIVEKDNIILDGSGYALDGARPTNRPSGDGITLSGRSNVTLKNIYITRFHVCIFLNHSSNNEISGNTLISTGWWPGSMTMLQLWKYSNSNVVAENIIVQETDDTHFEAIDIRRSFNNSILGNNVVSNGGCLSIDPYASNTTVSGNNFSAKTDVGISMIFSPSSPGGVNLWGSNTVFTNNVLFGSGLLIHNYENNIIANNTVNSVQLVFLDNAENINITSEGQHNACMYAWQVILSNCRNISVRNLGTSSAPVFVQLLATVNSEIFNCTGSITLLDSSNIRIIATHCSSIRLDNSDGNIMMDNNISRLSLYSSNVDNKINRLSLYSSNGNDIFGNNVTASSFAGIKIASSSGNKVHGNNITDNGDGIVLGSCVNTNNLIYENNIINNHHSGVFESSCSGNTFYRNNFINNSVQVMGWDSGDRWDNGSVGNFWSDYHGADADQNGIGDVPYPISFASHLPPGYYTLHDNYPLTTPPIPVIPEIPSWSVLPCVMATAVGALVYVWRRRAARALS